MLQPERSILCDAGCAGSEIVHQQLQIFTVGLTCPDNGSAKNVSHLH